ncbi:hypothetical protein K438DRAFT_1848712 [Mycena galopus ATCC 62051]|nr:hypothetical protein K438DRAFT_1848712 [Mycena galopus ATCC 62051]
MPSSSYFRLSSQQCLAECQQVTSHAMRSKAACEPIPAPFLSSSYSFRHPLAWLGTGRMGSACE